MNEIEQLVPSKFFLSQNFPNPFTDETKIKYCLPVQTKVTLTVFNSNDEKVKELVNKLQDAGTYEVKLKDSDLPAGEYYYQMRAINAYMVTGQSFEESKKMLLIK